MSYFKTVTTDRGYFYEPFAGVALSANWSTITDVGTSISVANSICSIASGITSGAKVVLYRQLPSYPVTTRYIFSISQRITNQDIYCGFGDNQTTPSSDTMFARFHFYGTDNTKVSCESQSSADTGGNQGLNTQIILPLGLNTSQILQYEIVEDGKELKYYVGLTRDELVLIATHSIQIPSLSTTLYERVRIANGTSPTPSTTISVDTIASYPVNILDTSTTITDGKIAVGQNVVVSSVNSSTTDLAKYPDVGSTFTGLAESTLNAAGIQVSLKTTQNCSVYVEQSPDGTNWDISDYYAYRYKGDYSFGLTVQAVSSYFRVRVINESTTTATNGFRLQSVLCPIIEALPRSLDSEGNLSICMHDIEDFYGNHVKISPTGLLAETKLTRLVGATFSGTTIDASFWQAAATNSGTVTQINGEFDLATSGGANATTYLQSLRSARYVSANAHYVRFQLDAGDFTSSTNIKRWGAWISTAVGTTNAPSDGAFFEVLDGVLTLATYNGTTPNRITNGNFNGTYGTTVNITPSGINLYEIIYNTSSVYFIYNGNYIHKITASTAPWTGTLILPIRVENINHNGGTTNTTIKVRSASIHRFGELSTSPAWANITTNVTATILKRGAGRLQKVVNNDNKGTIVLYDAITATNPIATIDCTIVLGTIAYELDFYTGLCYTTTGGPNLTVIFE